MGIKSRSEMEDKDLPITPAAYPLGSKISLLHMWRILLSLHHHKMAYLLILIFTPIIFYLPSEVLSKRVRCKREKSVLFCL
jgi:hypothetical protein